MRRRRLTTLLSSVGTLVGRASETDSAQPLVPRVSQVYQGVRGDGGWYQSAAYLALDPSYTAATSDYDMPYSGGTPPAGSLAVGAAWDKWNSSVVKPPTFVLGGPNELGTRSATVGAGYQSGPANNCRSRGAFFLYSVGCTGGTANGKGYYDPADSLTAALKTDNTDTMVWAIAEDTVRLTTPILSGGGGLTAMEAQTHINNARTRVFNMARDMLAHGHPVMFRWGWEMNGVWGDTGHYWRWQARAQAGNFPRGPTAAEYIAAWRKMWQRFADVKHGSVTAATQANSNLGTGTGNVSFAWGPNYWRGGESNVSDGRNHYPGDQYVDWILIDGYKTASGMTFDYVFGICYPLLVEMAPTKPLGVGETGATKTGSPAKDAWITDMFAKMASTYTKFKLICWFNEAGEPPDGHVEDPTAARNAYRAGIANARYLGNMVTSSSFPSGQKIPVPASLSPATVAVGQAVETDLARPIGHSRVRAIGQVAALEVAQPVTRVKVRTVGQTVEVDVAQAVEAAKTLTVALAVEADAAFPLTHSRSVPAGQAVEVDEAAETRHARLVSVGLASESDAAFAVAHSRVRLVGQPVEESLAFPVGFTFGGPPPAQTVPVSQAVTVEEATALSVSKVRTVGQPAEASTAGAVAAVRARAVAEAVESSSAGTVRSGRAVPVAAAGELAAASGVGHAKTRTVGRASETNLARVVGPHARAKPKRTKRTKVRGGSGRTLTPPR